jgi:hypothetical protein
MYAQPKSGLAGNTIEYLQRTGIRHMKKLLILASTAAFALAVAFPAGACPIGMLFNGSGCSPPYEYTGWDLLRDRRAAIDAIGSDSIFNRGPPAPGLTAEEAEALERGILEAEQERQRKLAELENGVWNVDSTSTPEGNLCAATFSMFTNSFKEGVIGGLVTIVGFQQPKQDAWLMFYGAKIPKPRSVKKLSITLQQDDEPAQTLQVFNFTETRDVGAIVFAVPGLTALVNGMSDVQRFRLSDGRKVLLDIEWHSAAPIIEKLKQCAR